MVSLVSSENLGLLKMLGCILYDNHHFFLVINFEFMRKPFFQGGFLSFMCKYLHIFSFWLL